MGKSFWLASAAVAALFVVPQVCAQGAKPATAPAVKVSAERMKMLTVAEGEFHCKGPTGNFPPPSDKFVKCTDIPVIVLLTTGGRCIVHVPYHDLVVHSKKALTTVTWNLIGPGNYKFDPNDGIAITNPGTTFTKVGPSASGTQYSWKVPANAVGVTTNHEAKVLAPNGKACEPGDPTITNDPN